MKQEHFFLEDICWWNTINTDTIDYVTIASEGDAIDFGDLVTKYGTAGFVHLQLEVYLLVDM